MAARQETLTALIEPVVEGLGYELVGLEYLPNPKNGLLRLYIDAPEGITLEDCTRVSHQVSGVLDVEDPIPGNYHLEVSSPGLDRPIFKAADYERFVGEQVRIRIQGILEGRRKFAGVLRGLEDEHVLVEEDEGLVRVPLGRIDKANLKLEA
ncbi:ribosome maturation factor RimP [Alkalilimnicola sp. S0819]|uniref:ribosome maturation factor RimP n=1 Tax=Alkalilimnicola sp. S0819 TaxID=2613922 RepID=UPI001261BA08|nr:ribosome maturation factor RimP [Alkalilimnicola sp. S0819]KAB7628439.1 ribosome maturation factor RimP [Alkalilimnicola sp. S0819]MPQ15343.1 ribosome maturation factor RimP [Alkalilimnicola sp. S0819]